MNIKIGVETDNKENINNQVDKDIKTFENGIGINIGQIFTNIVIFIICYIIAFTHSWKSVLGNFYIL